MDSNPTRIQFLDIMRGVAVIIMVMGHSIDSVLSTSLRSSEIFRYYDAFRGFTAPMFLFISGCAFSVATEKRWDEFRSLGTRTRKRFLRILLLFVVGYLLHLPFLSFDKLLHGASAQDYAQFFQADVLHCVAASLLLLHLMVFAFRAPSSFAATVGALTAFIALGSPVVWAIDFAPMLSSWVTPYLNQQQPSLFPIFPYAGFILAGVVTGHLFNIERAKGREKKFFAYVIAAGCVAIVAAIGFERLPLTVFPPHDYWKTSPNFFLIRLGAVAVATAGFYYFKRIPEGVVPHLVRLGQASFFVYAIHLIVVYGSAINPGLMQIVGQRLEQFAAVAVAFGMVIAMTALVHGWNYLRTHHYVPAKFVQVALASTFLFYFFTRPY